MPSFRDRKQYTIAANKTNAWITDQSGWLSNVMFTFEEDVSGDIAVQIKPYGADVYYPIATQTLSTKGTAIWLGSTYVTTDDTVRLVCEVATECNIYVTFDYENVKDGSWQTFTAGAGDQSSSSPSSSSQDSSSSSSSCSRAPSLY